MSFQFKIDNTLSERKQKSHRVLTKYSDRVPVICEKEISSNIKEMDRSKILVPRELTIAQFMKVIRKRIKLREEEAIFLYVNEKIMGTGKLISEVYASEKDEDGFLYVSYSSENVFG